MTKITPITTWWDVDTAARRDVAGLPPLLGLVAVAWLRM
jgi:hypothetical protein